MRQGSRIVTPRCKCGKPARTIHLLPGLGSATARQIACSAHPAGGFTFDLYEWRSPVRRRQHPAFTQSIRSYLLEHPGGTEIVDLVDAALGSRSDQAVLW
jgi:hypothetical protein